MNNELKTDTHLLQTTISGSYYVIHQNTANGLYYIDEKGSQTKNIIEAKKYKNKKAAENFINKELSGYGHALSYNYR